MWISRFKTFRLFPDQYIYVCIFLSTRMNRHEILLKINMRTTVGFEYLGSLGSALLALLPSWCPSNFPTPPFLVVYPRNINCIFLMLRIIVLFVSMNNVVVAHTLCSWYPQNPYVELFFCCPKSFFLISYQIVKYSLSYKTVQLSLLLNEFSYFFLNISVIFSKESF